MFTWQLNGILGNIEPNFWLRVSEIWIVKVGPTDRYVPSGSWRFVIRIQEESVLSELHTIVL